jgi:hypothetical protein
MALIYRATLSPTKLELLAGWLPKQPWFGADPASALANLAAYRFDDPDGEVGVETLLVKTADALFQVPLTYRSEPLDGGEPHLLGVMQHSVLGARYTYDGLGDPVYLATLATVVLAGAPQAVENVQEPHGLVARTPRAKVTGTGSANVRIVPQDIGAIDVRQGEGETTARTDQLELAIRRVLVAGRLVDGSIPSLTGTWTDQPNPTTLATVEIR